MQNKIFMLDINYNLKTFSKSSKPFVLFVSDKSLSKLIFRQTYLCVRWKGPIFYFFFQRSTKFSRAQYFCHLCEYHCDTIEICISHIEDTRHSRLAKKQELETTLYHLPRPNKKHLEALENLLLQIEREVGLSTIEMIQRETIAR